MKTAERGLTYVLVDLQWKILPKSFKVEALNHLTALAAADIEGAEDDLYQTVLLLLSSDELPLHPVLFAKFMDACKERQHPHDMIPLLACCLSSASQQTDDVIQELTRRLQVSSGLEVSSDHEEGSVHEDRSGLDDRSGQPGLSPSLLSALLYGVYRVGLKAMFTRFGVRWHEGFLPLWPHQWISKPVEDYYKDDRPCPWDLTQLGVCTFDRLDDFLAFPNSDRPEGGLNVGGLEDRVIKLVTGGLEPLNLWLRAVATLCRASNEALYQFRFRDVLSRLHVSTAQNELLDLAIASGYVSAREIQACAQQLLDEGGTDLTTALTAAEVLLLAGTMAPQTGNSKIKDLVTRKITSGPKLSDVRMVAMIMYLSRMVPAGGRLQDQHSLSTGGLTDKAVGEVCGKLWKSIYRRKGEVRTGTTLFSIVLAWIMRVWSMSLEVPAVSLVEFFDLWKDPVDHGNWSRELEDFWQRLPTSTLRELPLVRQAYDSFARKSGA
ncbi:hypothetical protein GNI_039760 [Gregarina niphandrodes]|uniref:Uncharacterized protein n=1 Tax=Gregarina niphandrodes TaxID=110365 RepID=A0A023BAH6_GRENI|nr:hypothetical protein GNI_039760 [Gregarina niphandrodes]EZG78216.1 hypothetical protein GNI_039760 [Gregarina niphandrodes]|eukprot:XP_011129405.1 hypothetical protein GNI_039760 [Gregarina niphandrodes]